MFFNSVRVPRANLLSRYGEVAPDGTYTARIEKVRDRFLKVSDQLMSGRIAIASCSLVIAQMCLAAALGYSVSRKQAVRGGGSTCLLDLLTQKNTLLPHLATIVGLRLGVNMVKGRYAD